MELHPIIVNPEPAESRRRGKSLGRITVHAPTANYDDATTRRRDGSRVV
jgi:hypothetical protein